MILQLTDDYTYRAHRLSIAEWVNNRAYLKGLRHGVKRAATVLVISEAMHDEYSRRFPGKYSTLMNSMDAPTSGERTSLTPSRVLLYAGNLGLERWRPLLMIGEALAIVDKGAKEPTRLHIFAPESTPEHITQRLEQCSAITLRGYVGPDELAREVKRARVLVHVESFSKRMRNVTRLSVSTKIPEYLAAGKPVFAFGPPDVESIRYLVRHAAAAVVTDESIESVANTLQKVLTDPAVEEGFVRRGIELYERNHTRARTRSLIDNAMAEAVRSC